MNGGKLNGENPGNPDALEYSTLIEVLTMQFDVVVFITNDPSLTAEMKKWNLPQTVIKPMQEAQTYVQTDHTDFFECMRNKYFSESS